MSRWTDRAGRSPGGLAGRIFAAQAFIAVVGAATVWVVASAIGPPIFHSHLAQVEHGSMPMGPQATAHVDEAFASASVISVGIALLVSLAAALGLSAYVTRRIAGPVVRLAAAATDIAAGHYQARVPASGLGAEFEALTSSFNAMAERLAGVESTRRRLLGDLAHEVRTPVATLDAYLEGLQDGVVQIEADTLAMLRGQTARLTRLAEDIEAVTLAEEQRLDLHPIPQAPAEVVERAVQAAQHRYAAASVELTADVTASLPPILVDPDRIGQVLGNLLDNALRHTPPSGRVTVTARPAPLPGHVELRVADTGHGIPAEHLSRVFERFYRVDRARSRSHGGSGVGLAIVKALAEAHGGTAAVASDGPGRGTTVTITLPAER